MFDETLHIVGEFGDCAVEQPRSVPVTMRQAVGMFLGQTGFKPISALDFQLHEAMHVLAGAVNGRIADEGRAGITEMVLLGGAQHDIRVGRDGIIECAKKERPTIADIRAWCTEIQTVVKAEDQIERAMRSEKSALLIRIFKDQTQHLALALEAITKDPFNNGAILTHLTDECRHIAEDALNRDNNIRALEKMKAAKFLTEDGFWNAYSRACAIAAHVENTMGKPFPELEFDKIMRTPLGEFGIRMAPGKNGKMQFVPFIPIPQVSRDMTFTPV